jgi:ABC-type transport system involved in multi-copper enzyme maturation permease subunit
LSARLITNHPFLIEGEMHMKDFWTVFHTELLFFRRGRTSWLMAIFMVFWGLVMVVLLRSTAYGAWNSLSIGYFILTLILTFLTGNQIQRDREQRLDSVVWSTPVATDVDACGKYATALLLVIGFAMLQLVASIIVDWLIPSVYPPLGPWPYLLSWCWLVLPALAFGSALTLFIITLSRRWIAAAIPVLLIWLLPFVLGGNIPVVINITGNAFNTTDPAQVLGATLNSPFSPPAALAQQVVHLVQVYVPQAHLTSTFLASRLLFTSLGVLLVLATMWGFRRQRQGN